MSEYFDELSQIWQNQKVSDKTADLKDQTFMRILDKIKQFEKKQLLINRIKTITVVLLMLFISYMIFFKYPGSLLTYLAYCGLLLCVFIFMRLYWKKQFSLKQLDFSKSNILFISTVLTDLQNHLHEFRKLFIPFLLFIILFLNILYLDFLSAELLSNRIIFHTLISIFIGLSGFAGLKIRAYRFKNEYQPVIYSLTSIQKEFRE